jgi:sialic acid synthase SpsE
LNVQRHTIIAELGINHEGDVKRAIDMAQAAIESGADAIKLQYYEAMKLSIHRGRQGKYDSSAKIGEEYRLLKRCQLSLDELCQIAVAVETARGRRRVPVFASVFDPADVLPYKRAGFKTIKLSAEQSLREEMVQAAAEHFGGLNERIIQSIGLANLRPENQRRKLIVAGKNVTTLWCPPGYPAAMKDIQWQHFFQQPFTNLQALIGLSLHADNRTPLYEIVPLLAGSGCTVWEFHFRTAIRDCPEKAWSLGEADFRYIRTLLDHTNDILGGKCDDTQNRLAVV